MMRIEEINTQMEPFFFDLVSNDVPNYYFFIFDWMFKRNDTKILMALEHEKIEGAMLSYKNRVIQLRGKLKAIELLLEELEIENIEVIGEKEHKEALLKRYKPSVQRELVLMKLEKGNEHSYQNYFPIELGLESAQTISNLMRDVLPEWWSQMTTENISTRMREGDLCYGIIENGRIVTVAIARVNNFGDRMGVIGHIGAVATDKQYRNKGYATSTVSQLVQKLLQRCNYVLLYVLSDNIPAYSVYSKIGFKPYKSYYFMHGTKVETKGRI